MYITKSELSYLIKEEIHKYLQEVEIMPRVDAYTKSKEKEAPKKEKEEDEKYGSAFSVVDTKPGETQMGDAALRTAQDYGLEASIGQAAAELGAGFAKGALKTGAAAAAGVTAPIELAVAGMETENPVTKALGGDYAGRAAKYAGTKQANMAQQWRKRLSQRQKDPDLNTEEALKKELDYLKAFMEKDKKTGRVSIRGYGGDYEQGYDQPKMHGDLSQMIKLNYVDVMKKLGKVQTEKQPLKITPDQKRKLQAQAKKLGIPYRQYVKGIKKRLRSQRRKRRLAKK